MLTITTKFDRSSEGLLDYAKSKGLWNGEVNGWNGTYNIITAFFCFQGAFNFATTFSSGADLENSRLTAGKKLLADLSSSNTFTETDMFTVLRDKESDICRPCDSAFPTQGSQVNILIHFSVVKPTAY